MASCGTVELDELLSALDRTAANLTKLEEVRRRAAPLLPSGPSLGSSPEYDDLCRAWKDLLAGLPLIDGWTITAELPDADGIGQAFIDYQEIGEPPFPVYNAIEQPDKELAQYRFRLNRARRRATRERLQYLTSLVDASLPQLLNGVPRESQDRLETPIVDQVTAAVGEIERLLGDATERRGRWGFLHRHMYFGQGHDWHDIYEFDWPSVRPDIEAAAFTDTDPLPVPDLDLGHAAAGQLTGAATIALPWDRLDDADFERLLYDLLRSFPEHQNVQWLMHTRAPDRGRDLSMERVLQTGIGTVRIERVMVQAKHWLKRSVAPADVASTVATVTLWPPPVVRGLIIATSGRFTADAVTWIEQHNGAGTTPFIEMWPDSTLETLLAKKPYIAAAHGLR